MSNGCGGFSAFLGNDFQYSERIVIINAVA